MTRPGAGTRRSAARTASAMACSADGRVFAAPKEAPGEPSELAVLDTASGGGMARTHAFNAALAGRGASTAERFAWRSDNGLEIGGLLVLPPEAGGEPLPLVVEVHGGPTNNWTFNFSSGYLPGPAARQAGYAVLLPNPRGSTGRGPGVRARQHRRHGRRRPARHPRRRRCLAEAGIADRERVGITGGSYGGFMSTWAVTQTDAFAASIPFARVEQLAELPQHDEHRPLRRAVPRAPTPTTSTATTSRARP